MFISKTYLIIWEMDHNHLMRCLTAADVEVLFGPAGFSVSLEHVEYRSALVLKQSLASKQTRLEARPPRYVRQLVCFACALIRWLPTKRCRLLWVDHWEPAICFAEDFLIAAVRKGLGELRPLDAAPGHYFDPHPWDEEDQIEISPEQDKDLAILSGLMLMTMATGSDGWLIADECPDRIEFWEGNLFLHSSDTTQFQAATRLLDDFQCSRTLR